MSRYFRIVYGPEYYIWENGDFVIEQSFDEVAFCNRSMFQVSDEEWASFDLSSSYCPVLNDNFFISG